MEEWTDQRMDQWTNELIDRGTKLRSHAAAAVYKGQSVKLL